VREERSSKPAGRDGRAASRTIVAGVQAFALYAAYVLGGPWLRSGIIGLLPNRPWSDSLLDGAMLALVGLAAFLFTRPIFGTHGRLRSGASPMSGLGAASEALLLLGLLALALRIVDPAYDERELGGRGLDSPAALLGFLALLPLGVAAEEVVFRSCQSRLRAFLRPAPAAVAVALGFAAYHWVPGWTWDRHRIETEIALLAGGLVLAAAFEKAASVPLLVAVHLTYDNLAVVQAWLNVRGARGAEAALFLLWLAVSGTLAWRCRRPERASRAIGPSPGVSAAAEWMAAALFGCGLPLAIDWIRLRFRI